jgi:6-phosphogluconolactonase (cycloisomerase 2 family)
MAVHPSGAFAYAVDLDAQTIVGFAVSRDAADGGNIDGGDGDGGTLAPVPGSPVAIGAHPIAIAVDPAGKLTFVGTGGGVYVHSVDPSTGALTPVTGSPFATDRSPIFLAVDPSGRFLYLADGTTGSVHGYGIDRTTGVLTELAGSPFGTPTVRAGAIACDPLGRFVFTAGGGVSALALDATTGALTLVTGSPFSHDVNSDAEAADIAVDPLGRFVYATSVPNGHLSVFSIDAASGALSPVAGSPFDAGFSPYSVTAEPSGHFVYVGNDDSQDVSGFAVGASGAMVPIAGSPFTAGGLQPGIAVVR